MRHFIFVSLLLGACADDWHGPTGGADLEIGPDRAAYSAWAAWNPSYALDGTTMRGWVINFSRADAGLDCARLQLDAEASIDIFTDHAATGALGDVPTGALALTMDSQPLASDPQTSISLAWEGVASFTGTLTIDSFTETGITGSISGTAVPFDTTFGATQTVTGTFDAAACGHLAF